MAANDETVWRAPLILTQVPDGGLHITIEADAATREAMALAAGIRTITQAAAQFEITPHAGGAWRVTGRVQARVGQTCVVTLEPLENAIDEAVDATFVPQAAAQTVQAQGGSRGQDGNNDENVPDPPEPIVNGQIDLGRLAQEFLILGIDPYPRKDGAVFDVPETPPDPDDHPFAGLKALKDE